MIRVALIVVAIALSGCAATTPLIVAEAGGHQIARKDEDRKVRAAAALKEEPDLLTYSVDAIVRGKTEEAVATYMKGYSAPDYSQNMKSLALYQVALLYMNRYNDQRDDDKARAYLQQHSIEFPASRLKPRIDKRLSILNQRAQDPVDLSAKQLLKRVDRKQLLLQQDIPFDAQLTPMSERAITQERVADAETVYLILYDNKASSAHMRAKALYQLGLIYMSPYNRHGNNDKALAYFRKISQEFPDTEIAQQASKRINTLINRQ
ncbi:tetratricopeptide repeat protein [Bacterioplanes sanyensis]|nr:tetratricopeptide repeat protein [Bacterioplanes sanyensis]